MNRNQTVCEQHMNFKKWGARYLLIKATFKMWWDCNWEILVTWPKFPAATAFRQMITTNLSWVPDFTYVCTIHTCVQIYMFKIKDILPADYNIINFLNMSLGILWIQHSWKKCSRHLASYQIKMLKENKYCFERLVEVVQRGEISVKVK